MHFVLRVTAGALLGWFTAWIILRIIIAMADTDGVALIHGDHWIGYVVGVGLGATLGALKSVYEALRALNDTVDSLKEQENT